MSFWRLHCHSVVRKSMLIVKAPKYQRRVGTAKPERVRQYHIDFAFARRMRYQVDLCLDGRVVEIERRRCNLVAYCQNREDGLDGPGGPQQMADRRFSGRHRNTASLLADQPLHRTEFDLVAERCRSAMRIDVIDFGGRDVGAPESGGHSPPPPRPPPGGVRRVLGRPPPP